MASTLSKAVTEGISRELLQGDTQKEQYKSRWKSLNEQRQDGEFCDAIITTKGGSFHAHTCVLAAVSEFFKVMFSISPSPEEKHTANLDNFSEKTVSILLDIIYGNFTSESEDLSELLKLVDCIQYKWLLNNLISTINANMHDGNCVLWQHIAKDCGNDRLFSLAEIYIETNCKKLVDECDSVIDTCDSLLETITNLQIKNKIEKEVVLYQCVQEQTMYLIDPDENICEKYSGEPYSITDMLSGRRNLKNSFRHILSMFMHENKLFVVCFNYQYDTGRNTFEIYKFQRPKQFEKVFEISQQDLTDKVENPEEGYEYDFALNNVAYDNSRSIYVLFNFISGVFVFKLDLNKMLLSQSYFQLYGDYWMNTTAFVEYNDVGMLLIQGIDEVYSVTEFNFNDTDHREIDNKMNLEDQPEICMKIIDPKTYPTFHAVSLNGEVYFFATTSKKPLVVSVLKMDVKRYLWIHLCDLNVSGALGKVFCCEGKLYLVLRSVDEYEFCTCRDEKSCKQYGTTRRHYKDGEVYDYVSVYDNDEKKLNDTGMQLMPSHELRDAFNVFSHLIE